MYEAIKARGDEDFTSEDIDNMAFTNAVIKVSPARTLRNGVLTVIQEVLRRHSPVIELERVTWKDHVLPLTRPMVGRSGKVHHHQCFLLGVQSVRFTVAGLRRD